MSFNLNKEFTFELFGKLLQKFIEHDYRIMPFVDSIGRLIDKSLILRHDVDRFPKQTIKMANLEASMGIRSTYYFRIIPSVFKPELINKVAQLGHEIGYHYEDLTLKKGDYRKAIESFQVNLDRIRKYYPVTTICMHGSPISPWDNKKIWEKYDYREFGVTADTAFDIDYNKVFYISDNGFGWNKINTSIRDKVKTKFNIPINNTYHLMDLIERDLLPNNIMLNAHPDTFFDPGLRWILNYTSIKSKNLIKWVIVKSRIYK